MRRLFVTAIALALPSTTGLAQNRGKEPLVEFEMMTWPEVRQIQTFIPPK